MQLCKILRYPYDHIYSGRLGLGKTSMMREKLKDDIWPIWFNTWQFSQFNMGSSLVFSMIDVLPKKLDCDRSSIGKILGGIARNVVRVAADRVGGGVVEEMVSDVMNGDSADYACEILELKEKFQKAVNDKLDKEKKTGLLFKAKLLDDFGLPANTEISTSPFVFRGGEQWKEWNEERPMLKKLMNALKIKPYFIFETNIGYEVSEF